MSYFCKIYKCDKKSAFKTGYCEDHASGLRPGLETYAQGSAPVKYVKISSSPKERLMRPNWASQGFKRRKHVSNQ